MGIFQQWREFFRSRFELDGHPIFRVTQIDA